MADWCMEWPGAAIIMAATLAVFVIGGALWWRFAPSPAESEPSDDLVERVAGAICTAATSTEDRAGIGVLRFLPQEHADLYREMARAAISEMT